MKSAKIVQLILEDIIRRHLENKNSKLQEYNTTENN